MTTEHNPQSRGDSWRRGYMAGRAEIKQDIRSFLKMLDGDIDRDKIVNFIRESIEQNL